MVKKFRKKPVEIEAIRWDGSEEALAAIKTWGAAVSRQQNGDLIVETLEDGAAGQVKHYATKGDYIIRGVLGEFYPCKLDIFEKTYDSLGE
jgi:hypothetical protein